MRLTKEQKGITLIALVITIIVLLILAGVALATLTGNGSIIDNANYAVTEYNKSAGNDQNVLNQVENLFAKYMGESSNEGDDDETPTERQLLSITVSPGDYIIYNPELGVAVADKATLLNYTSSAGTLKVKNSSNEYVVNEEGTSTYEYNGAYNLLDEYGEFVVPSGYTVDTNGDVPGNGHSSQSFTAEGTNTLWRVLDVNESTGVVKIVPETPIQTTANADFCLNGLRGYKNAKTELDNISRIFGHGQGANGAESITLETLEPLTGYEIELSEDTTWVIDDRSWYSTYCYYPKDDSLETNINSMIFKNNDGYWLANNTTYTVYEEMNGISGVMFNVSMVYPDERVV